MSHRKRGEERKVNQTKKEKEDIYKKALILRYTLCALTICCAINQLLLGGGKANMSMTTEMEAEMEWDISHPTLLSTPPRDKFYSQTKDNEKDKDDYGEEDMYNRCEEDEYGPRFKVSKHYLPAPTSYSPPRDAWSEEKGYPCIFKVPFELMGAKAYAEKSLEYYNKKNGTNYKHFCSLLCKNFSGNRNRGSWVHCNFSAKQDVDGKPSCKIFFAEILLDRNDRSMKETLTITACLLLEGIATAGCNLCSNVLHPANGFLKGQNKPRRSNSSSSPPYSPSSPASPSSPMSPDFSGKENPVSVELRRQADIALEHFNKGNGTDYKLVDVLDGNSIYWEGYWFHFNFTANSPKDDIDGESSSKLFFAENFAVIADTVTWTTIACHLLDGKTTDGCIFCRGIVHPTYGFSQGITRAQIARSPLCNTVPRDLEAENHDRRAEFALEYFNKEHGTNYELVLVMAHSSFSSNGYHYNFEAKQEVDGKYTWRIFFAELLSIFHPRSEKLTVGACLILGGETTAGCSLCSDIIHPASWESPKENHESLSSSLTNSPTFTSREKPDSSVNMRSDEIEVEDEVSAKQANIALEHFNKENGTNYHLADVLDGNGIYCEGEYWFHCNFKANSPKGDIDGESSSKLFFAENFAVIAETVTWTANACHLLDGKTTDGCAFCRGIIHPTHGFSQGSSRAQINRCPEQSNTVPRDLPSTEKRCRRAEIAIEFYNHNNNSDYEVVEVFLSNGFLSDGTWYHFNFEAKHDVDGKYTSKIFFAELFADNNHPTTETLTVTACQILNGETTGCCGFCSNVIHPSQGGFLKLVLE